MKATHRMPWLLARTEGFNLNKDHHNLIFLFHPLAVVPDLAVSSLRMLLLWASRLSMHNYKCVKVKGMDKVRTDIIGRWSKTSNVYNLVSITELLASKSNAFDWPSD